MGVIVTVGVFLFENFTHSVTPSPGNLAAIFFCFGIVSGYIRGEREWEQCERAYDET